ncbi:YeiH family protein [Lichenibacterium ramalinae]|uniref:Putative sulfate exporter family transporter n=1 Tax=Lichenibacterium ramalinae TaxID=2316527 RepID=A0A4Q2R8E4_9HYPH|nr:putative sulfate exporter family transporter [Lichenibacterium ramalinae]RYB03090.1 putative sulfate exporter family transporter [Lichenibacterium ramalinae]
MTTLALNRIVLLARILPGVMLCVAVALLADRLVPAEIALTGRLFVDPVVLAILLGTSVRAVWRPGAAWAQGITCSAKVLLECSVVLIGASIDANTLSRLGPTTILSVGLLVVAAVTGSYGFARAWGLPHRLSVLIACGNAICGNAAIGAVAPLVGADARDITTAVSFTAVFGLLVVLTLPTLIPILHLTPAQYGELAGLTVYSIPQVLAATAPVGILSSQIGTIVKLSRVLMLGPVVLGIAGVQVCRARRVVGTDRSPPETCEPPRIAASVSTFVPWFLVGFVGLASCRSAGLLPGAFVEPAAVAAHLLTVVSMAALGLNVDIRTLTRCGNRIALAVAGSLAGIFLMSLAIVRGLSPS